MDNERQETIADIVQEMRNLGRLYEKSTDKIPRSLQALGLRTYADRILAAHKRFYDKYKEHTNDLNRQILVLKREKGMSDTYFCGYDPEEALVAQCSTCRFFHKKYSHCKLHDSLTNAKYKCSGWKFKTNKECADEYKDEINREFEKLRAENASLRVINCGNYYADEQLRGELAMKDAEIEKLKFDNMRLKSEQRTASEIEYRRICASRLSLANEENSHGIQ